MSATAAATAAHILSAITLFAHMVRFMLAAVRADYLFLAHHRTLAVILLPFLALCATYALYQALRPLPPTPRDPDRSVATTDPEN